MLTYKWQKHLNFFRVKMVKFTLAYMRVLKVYGIEFMSFK